MAVINGYRKLTVSITERKGSNSKKKNNDGENIKLTANGKKEIKGEYHRKEESGPFSKSTPSDSSSSESDVVDIFEAARRLLQLSPTIVRPFILPFCCCFFFLLLLLFFGDGSQGINELPNGGHQR